MLSKYNIEKMDDYDKYHFANSVERTQEEIFALSKDKEYVLRMGVAKNPNTPKETLGELSKDGNWDVRVSVASNPNTPKEILIALSKDKNITVIGCVAYNPNTPIDVLITLSKNENSWVREGVALNPNTPKETLLALSEDKNSLVRESALKILEKLNDPSHQAKIIEDKMTNNTNTLDKLLEDKGYDKNSGIGKELVTLYNETQAKLQSDLDELKAKVVNLAISDFTDR